MEKQHLDANKMIWPERKEDYPNVDENHVYYNMLTGDTVGELYRKIRGLADKNAKSQENAQDADL